MEGGSVYSGSNMTVFLQNDRIPPSSDALESLWISNSSPPVHGDSYSCSTSMVNSEDVKGENQRNMTMFPPFEKEENGMEDCDGCYYQPEKKRRLTADQVHCLERNFEVENKLEPERKLQLAKELGLQPRQVAIWFQNRRARYKTKQLEKDYGALKVDYDKLMGNYDSLLKEKERLKNEVQLLAEKLIHREKEETNSESTQTINPIVAEYQKQILNSDSEMKSKDPMLLCKQEDASSAKSDVFDSEQSDGENELFPKSLLPTQLFFPKLEDGYFDDQTENTYNWSFSVEGQPSWLWPS